MLNFFITQIPYVSKYEWSYAYLLLFFGDFLLPRYFATNFSIMYVFIVKTKPEFTRALLETRLSSASELGFAIFL